MKKLALAAALSITATAVAAGAPPKVEPVMEPEVVVEETTATSDGGILVPLLFLIFVGAALAAD